MWHIPPEPRKLKYSSLQLRNPGGDTSGRDERTNTYCQKHCPIRVRMGVLIPAPSLTVEVTHLKPHLENLPSLPKVASVSQVMRRDT